MAVNTLKAIPTIDNIFQLGTKTILSMTGKDDVDEVILSSNNFGASTTVFDELCDAGNIGFEIKFTPIYYDGMCVVSSTSITNFDMNIIGNPTFNSTSVDIDIPIFIWDDDKPYGCFSEIRYLELQINFYKPYNVNIYYDSLLGINDYVFDDKCELNSINIEAKYTSGYVF